MRLTAAGSLVFQKCRASLRTGQSPQKATLKLKVGSFRVSAEEIDRGELQPDSDTARLMIAA